MVQYSAEQYSTVKYSTVQYSTVQYIVTHGLELIYLNLWTAADWLQYSTV